MPNEKLQINKLPSFTAPAPEATFYLHIDACNMEINWRMKEH